MNSAGGTEMSLYNNTRLIFNISFDPVTVKYSLKPKPKAFVYFPCAAVIIVIIYFFRERLTLNLSY